jgi:hypothetical protein
VAASIAGSIYLALSKAEKVARPEALAEISAVLKDPSWSRAVKPWSIVERLFVLTFGERHLSLKCISRSAASTVIMVVSLVVFHMVLTGEWDFLQRPVEYLHKPGDHLIEVVVVLYLFIFIFTVLAAFIPDYVALLKTRYLLKNGSQHRDILVLCLDIVGSIAISCFPLFAFSLLTPPFSLMDTVRSTLTYADPVYDFLRLTTFNSDRSLGSLMGDTLWSTFYFSTLFTSIWLTLIVLSTTFIKLLAPLHRFTAWFFNVERHPLEAVGIVAAALVMLGAAIWAVVQKL